MTRHTDLRKKVISKIDEAQRLLAEARLIVKLSRNKNEIMIAREHIKQASKILTGKDK